MPFGLTTAPSGFQRLMDFVLNGLSYITCLVYIDDVIVFGKSFEQLERLKEVFKRLKEANLKLKPSKCSLFRREVEYPLLLIDNCLNALTGSSWYSTLDLRSGYYNIPIAEED